MDSRQQAILRTLLYADLFDYPLTKDQIFRFLISKKNIGKQELFSVLKNKSLPIEQSGEYFYLTQRKSLVTERQKRKTVSSQKLELAKKIINKISFISSIKLIGISGALSMENCDEDDDIDFFVITDKNLVWTTRLLLIILLTFLGVYRNRKSKNHSNKICLNMILDEDNLCFGKINQDLYTAHEIVQLLPILNKEETYEKFINNNPWIKNYIANFTVEKNFDDKKNVLFDRLIVQLFKLLQIEKIARFFQLKYMKNHRTNEITKDGFLKFHPYDYKAHVLASYKKELQKRGL